MDKKGKAPPEEMAKHFYSVAKANISDNSRVSEIYPVNLPEGVQGSSYIEEFSQEMRKLAERDGFRLVILKHADLSDEERKDLTGLLMFSNNRLVVQEMNDESNLSNRVYFQLQRARL